jgi:glycosyltransferase involved in cell wall biosynthesis
MKKISWFTPSNVDESGELWYSQGYSNAAISTIKGLQSRGVGVFYNRRDIPYHINFCQPMYYQTGRSYTVGYTPWESTKVPESWRQPVSECDELWATSEFVKEVYEKNNLHHNIHVIPHGISDEFEIYDREITGKFNFLHVGGESKRKNVQLVVDAFLDLYEGQDDFQLVLKYNKFCDAEVYLNGRMVPAYNHPQIYAVSHNLTTEEMAQLYHKCHCLVYPTKGEGFGMIPFEAIATGMPSIVTNLTGTADFAKYSIPLEAEWDDANQQSSMYAFDAGQWASPSYDALCDLMEHVVNEYDDFKKYTMQSARILHETRSWGAVADMIINRLDEYEKNF